MSDLNENDVLSEVSEVSNTDTQEQSDIETVSESDAEIDAINEVMAEENEEQDEPVNNSDRLETETGTVAENATTEPFGNSEQLEPEPYVCPWADAPKNVIFYEKMYEDGHLGGSTESAEMAYKFGWYENRISKDDVQQSDVNGFIYRKEVCPMKSERELQVELWNREILELKEELNRTDYKALKYAEGVMTDEDYQPTGIQRQAWRKRINDLERLIAG